MVDNLTCDVTDTIASVQMANEYAMTFSHPAYRMAEDRLRALNDEDVALVVRITGGLEPVEGRVQALVRGASALEPLPAPTLRELCETMRITATPINKRPPWADEDGATWRGQGWSIILLRQGRKPGERMEFPFWTGEAYGTTKPTAVDVMDCLCSDAAGIENARGFEDWAADLGYNTDSRRAEAVYKRCGELANELRAFLGNDFETFLWAEQD